MQALGYILLARILFATLVLDQISSSAVERRVETMDLSEARQSLTKSTLEFKGLAGTSEGNGIGGFIGARYAVFLAPNLFIGGGGYAGRLTGSGAGNVGYGGILAGLELQLTPIFALEAMTLIGGGGANYNTNGGPTTNSGLVIEPQGALTAKFVPGLRVGGQVSYISFANMPQISGFTVSLVIDFRRFSLSVPD